VALLLLFFFFDDDDLCFLPYFDFLFFRLRSCSDEDSLSLPLNDAKADWVVAPLELLSELMWMSLSVECRRFSKSSCTQMSDAQLKMAKCERICPFEWTVRISSYLHRISCMFPSLLSDLVVLSIVQTPLFPFSNRSW
jgi:hypothetical protein